MRKKAILFVFLLTIFAVFALWRTNRREIVASVQGRSISSSQLERALRERLWLEGKTLESLSKNDLAAARNATLEELIDDELLRHAAESQQPPIQVTGAEIDARIRLFSSRFYSEESMLSAMKAQGLGGSLEDLRKRFTDRIRQEKFLESQIAPAIQVSEVEAREWFSKNRKSLETPERVEARHIFLPTLDHPSEEAKAKLAAALPALLAGQKDFAALAKELSEDPANKDRGGSLGWMTRERLPEDFANAAFSLPLHQPALIQTHLGWHILEITNRKPAELPTFDQAKPEILAALQTAKRQQAIHDFRDQLKSHAGEIRIFEGK